MKKLLILCCFSLVTLSFSGVAEARNLYLEGMGTYGMYADASSMPGGMFGIGCSVNDYTNFYARGFYGAVSAVNSAGDKTKENAMYGSLGVLEFTFIPAASFPLLLSASAGLGMCGVDIKDGTIAKKEGDVSPCGGAWLGVKYIWTQSLMVTASAGYFDAFAFSDKLQNKSVKGPQFLLGVTFTVCGANASIEEGY